MGGMVCARLQAHVKRAYHSVQENRGCRCSIAIVVLAHTRFDEKVVMSWYLESHRRTKETVRTLWRGRRPVTFAKRRWRAHRVTTTPSAKTWRSGQDR